MDAAGKRKILIIIAAVAVIAIAIIVAAVIISNSNNNSDPYEKVTYTVDEEDLKSFNSETTNRSCIGNDYNKKAQLFVNKVLADDDRDRDGNSTLQSCIDSLKKECPSDMTFPEFLLKYLQRYFTYTSDAEQYGVPDWAVYPTEMLSLKKGDCEDYAILSEAILNRAGYSCGIAVFHNHAVALVAGDYDISATIKGYNPVTVQHEGKTYFVLDASFDGPIGYTDDDYTSGDIKAMIFA